VNAALPKLEASCPLRWSKYAITFDSTDQLKCSVAAGVLLMLCALTISNVLVTKTLIDGGTGLNVLSVETFEMLQVPYDQLQPTKPFSGVTDGSTVPIGKIRLPVAFGMHENYHTELIDFDVAHASRTMPSSGIRPSPSSWRRRTTATLSPRCQGVPASSRSPTTKRPQRAPSSAPTKL
jgi:hypothetical protein